MKRSKYALHSIVFILCIMAYLLIDTREEFTNKDIDTSNIYLVSYGDNNFKQSKVRLQKEAVAFGVSEKNLFILGPDDIDTEYKHRVRNVIHMNRGGGYWIWKPYIIQKLLNKINENQYLIYLDVGSTIRTSGKDRFNTYLKMISPETGNSILLMNLKRDSFKNLQVAEELWTTEALFQYFNIRANDPIRKSDQLLAGFLMIRKTAESVKFIDKWYSIAKERPDLFTDMYNTSTKLSNLDFIDNRHDQSVLSLLGKQFGNQYNVKVIPEEVENCDMDKPFQLSRIRK